MYLLKFHILCFQVCCSNHLHQKRKKNLYIFPWYYIILLQTNTTDRSTWNITGLKWFKLLKTERNLLFYDFISLLEQTNRMSYEWPASQRKCWLVTCVLASLTLGTQPCSPKQRYSLMDLIGDTWLVFIGQLLRGDSDCHCDTLPAQRLTGTGLHPDPDPHICLVSMAAGEVTFTNKHN